MIIAYMCIHSMVKVAILYVLGNRGNNAQLPRNRSIASASARSYNLMVVPIIGSSGYTLMISFHKIIGGYLSPFATSFALRPSGSIRRHMRAIKHPLESETKFPQRRRTRSHPVHPSHDIFKSLFSRQLQTYYKKTLDKMQHVNLKYQLLL